MKKLWKVVVLGSLLVAFGLFAGWRLKMLQHQTSVQVSTSPTQAKLKVLTSFYPFADFAQAIGGDLVTVENLTPAGVEPHDFEPTPQALTQLYKADLFIYSGAGLETWAERSMKDLNIQGVSIVPVGKKLPLVGSPPDPHFWLDPVLAKQAVEIISQEIQARDPAHQAQYAQQTAKYVAQLEELDRQFRVGLQNCQSRSLVTSHEAFGYLAKRYNLEVLPIAGFSPDSEPSPKQLAQLSTLAKKNNVKAVYFETLVSPKLAQTVADTIGAQTLVLNPLEGLSTQETSAGQNYLTTQAQNLANIRIGLECH